MTSAVCKIDVVCKMDVKIPGLDTKHPSVRVEGTYNPKAGAGVTEVVTKMWSRAKDVSDALGIGSKFSELLGMCAPVSWTPWTAHMKSSLGRARGAMAPFYWPTTLRKAWETKDPRDWTEAMKIGGFTAAAIVPHAKMSEKILAWTGIPGIVLDFFDLDREVKLSAACANLKAESLTPEVRKIVSHQMWTSTCKILKLCLTLFAGIAMTGAWLTACPLPTALATAALVASLGGLILAFVIGYADTNAQWTPKVTLFTPVETPKTTV